MGNTNESLIYIVDDNAAVRDAISWLVQEIGLSALPLDSAQSFLDNYQPERPGCLVLDVRMPGMSGLVLQDKLVRDEFMVPVIVITGHGDVPMAVKAMKMGAFDFLQKPFNDQELLDSILKAIERHKKILSRNKIAQKVADDFATLTPRELEVLNLLRRGNSSKEIARKLEISVRTVEGHRSKIMGKMQANSLAQLIDAASRRELSVL